MYPANASWTRGDVIGENPGPRWWGRREGNVRPGPDRLLVGLGALLSALVVLGLTATWWEGLLWPAEHPSAHGYVSLNETNWDPSGTSGCWENLFSAGGTVPVGGVFHASVLLRYPFGTTGSTCTARSVQVMTPGFSLLGSNAPVVVGPGTNEWLSVNLTVPNIPFTGAVTIVVEATSP